MVTYVTVILPAKDAGSHSELEVLRDKPLVMSQYDVTVQFTESKVQ